MPTLELEERVARLEGRIDEHSRFFESISLKLTLLDDKGDRNREGVEEKIDRTSKELEKKIDRFSEELGRKDDVTKRDLEDKIETVRKEMAINFRWIVGIQITTWITILLAILFK